MQTLASLHTFGLASNAQNVLSINSHEELQSALTTLKSTPYIVLGEGSNTVFLKNYDGTILNIKLKGITLEQTDSLFIVSIAAGENWHALVKWCLQHQLFGLENLALIPGSVGAAPIQNIGAYGVELAQFVHEIEYMDVLNQELKILKSTACNFGYRDSVFKNELLGKAVITKVNLKLPKAWQAVTHYGELKDLVNPTPKEIFEKIVEVRQTKLPDPKKLGNAGSFFKNPIIDTKLYNSLKLKWPSMPSYEVNSTQVKIPAAWLIDTLGFKGKKIGGISCHVNQPLVLTNNGTGTGAELLQLARDIKNKVQTSFSIILENEVRLIGKNGATHL